jgi:hypothetical protein
LDPPLISRAVQEPFLAIVVDPHRTVAAGKVEIGAFRTYPEVGGSAGWVVAGRWLGQALVAWRELPW